MRSRILFVIGATLLACGQEGPQGPPGPPGLAAGAGEDSGATTERGERPTRDGDGGALIPPAPPSSGTRIKARTSVMTTTTQTSDGATSVTRNVTQTWFDTLRDEPCAFQAAGDGKTRCIPASLAVRDASGGSYFQDSGCAVPLGFTLRTVAASCGATVLPAPPAPKYVLTSAAGATCGGQSVRVLGAQIAPSASVYIKSGVSCVPTTAQPAFYDYFAIGTEIPPTAFVESTTMSVSAQSAGVPSAQSDGPAATEGA
jgi:hypothetical protein